MTTVLGASFVLVDSDERTWCYSSERRFHISRHGKAVYTHIQVRRSFLRSRHQGDFMSLGLLLYNIQMLLDLEVITAC